MIRTLWLMAAAILTLHASDPYGQSRQLVVVTSDGWKSPRGVLRRFEKRGSSWREVGRPISVVVGKNGMGWGRGLHGYAPGAGPRKHEGDGRAPSGIFRLPFLFGEGKDRFRYPYRQMTRYHHCVDDSRSRYYNRIVDSREVERDYHSFERMKFPSGLYRYGIFVDHNHAQIPRGGSCIFLHIRKPSGAPTVGCTAMKQKELVELMRWLDPSARPLLVQAPRGVIRGLLPDNLRLTERR